MIFKGFLSHSNIVLDSPIGILCGVHIVLHTLELLTMKEAKKGPNVYIYIYVYMYIYVYIYMYIYIHVYIHIYLILNLYLHIGSRQYQ